MEATSFAKIVEQHVRKALKGEAVHGESKHGGWHKYSTGMPFSCNGLVMSGMEQFL